MSIFFEELHVRMSIHGGVVLSWVVPFCVPALMGARCLGVDAGFEEVG